MLLCSLRVDSSSDAGFEYWVQDKSRDVPCDGGLSARPSPLETVKEGLAVLPDDELSELWVLTDPECIITGALLRRERLAFLKMLGKPELAPPAGIDGVNSAKLLPVPTLSGVPGVLLSSLRMLERRSFLKRLLDLLLDDINRRDNNIKKNNQKKQKKKTVDKQVI